MKASKNGYTEIVKILLEKEGIDINAKDILLFLSRLISILLYFKIMIGNFSNYYGQHL